MPFDGGHHEQGCEQQPRIVTFAGGHCLASSLCRDLLALSDDERLATQVVLPTARLANRITAQACQEVGGWYEPRFFTFDGFIDFHAGEQAAHHNAGALPAAASDAEATLLLGHLIRQGHFRHINISHVNELRQLFNEFEDWSFRAEGFEKIREVLSQNNLRSDEAVANLFERVDEAERLYRQFISSLETAGKIPARRRQVLKANLLIERITSGAGPGCERVIIAGITSVMPWSRPLISCMAKHWPLTVWLPEASETAGSHDPIQQFLQLLGADDARPSPTVGELAAEETHTVTIHHATGIVDEAAAALNLVNDALDAGILPTDIGILVTNDHEYGKPLRALLNQYGKTSRKPLVYNAAITDTFATSQSGSWLAALSRLKRRGEDVAAINSFLSHPVTLAYVKRTVPDVAARPAVLLRGDFIRALCDVGVESGMEQVASALAQRYPELGISVASINESCKVFLQRELELPLSAWNEHFSVLLAHFRPAEAEDKTSVGRRLSIQAALSQFQDLMTAPLVRDEVMDAVVFFEIMERHLLGADIRDTGDQMKGVQILSVEEARFVPFRLLLILGCNEGTFPRAIPRDYLFDNYIKTKIGLPGWQAAEAIEATTFRLLKARTPNLHLFYTENPADGLRVRSRFIDDIRRLAAQGREAAPIEIQVAAKDALAPWLLGPQDAANAALHDRYQEQVVATAGHVTIEREKLLGKLSATSLEALLKCPYRFLLRQLGVRELELPEEDDLRKEGDWLHAVLEQFFAGLGGSEKDSVDAEECSDLPSDEEEFFAFTIERLEALTAKLCPAHLIGSETWVQARTIGWPAFARHVTRLYQEGGIERASLGARELQYKAAVPLVTADDAGTFAPVLGGKIDSIDVPLPGVHLITDYKRSGAPDKNEVLAGRSPQLTLYAAALDQIAQGGGSDLPPALQELRLANTIIGYWSILKGEFTGIAAGSAVRAHAEQLGLISARSKTPHLEEVFSALSDAVRMRRSAFLSSDAVTPEPGACQFCNYVGICRKDDPRYRIPTEAEGSTLA